MSYTTEEYEERIKEMQTMIDEQFELLDERKKRIKKLKEALEEIDNITRHANY